MCFANNLATLGFFTPAFGSPAFNDRNTSAALIPDAVTTSVCGAPVGLAGVGASSPHCFFRKAERLSRVRGSVHVLVSLMVRAIAHQHTLNLQREEHILGTNLSSSSTLLKSLPYRRVLELI